MAVSIRCFHCNKKLRAPSEKIGLKIKCPSCSRLFVAEECPAALRHQPRNAISESGFSLTDENDEEYSFGQQNTNPPSLEEFDFSSIDFASPIDVLVSTGDVPARYQIVDLVYAYGNSSAGFFQSVNPADAYKIATKMLAAQAKSKGCNGVINIRLDYRVALAQPGIAAMVANVSFQCFEVFGYGTAIRLLPDEAKVQ